MTRLLLVVLAAPALASAHPLGNFTINRWAALRVEPRALVVRYVVDMAEIPAFQEIAAIDGDGDGRLGDSERESYLAHVVPALAAGLEVRVDGAAVPLVPGASVLELPPGAGGLPTLRLEATFAAPLRAARGTVDVRDRNYAGRPGWREMIADAGDGLALVDSTVPRTDRSEALRAYPADLLASPPEVEEARFRFAAGGAPAGEGAALAVATVGSRRGADRLTELVATGAPLGPGLVVSSLLVAAALGAAHALGPGHGKTIVGAYLVGARGTARHAVFLGLVVTATHTLGVYALGLVTLAASRWIVPERLFPWLSAASGLVVLALGASLASARLRGAHAHDHPHPHLPPGAPGALSWRSLVALGVSGGLLPCPSALVVMLGAIALGRVAFGLALIVAFSAGLAAVLTAIGVVFVHARRWFEGLPGGGSVARWAPVASALAISGAGLLIVARAVVQLGLPS
jgi:ABC-type nickel/cobalt efflux system permease component RcnA